MSRGIICINSTVEAERAGSKDGPISPFHGWGFELGPGDVILCHKRTRFEIVYRARIGGLDLRILWQTVARMARGQRDIYLVTQPDIIQAIPALCSVCPALRVVTWVWTADEVARWKAALKRCQHIFCLTEPALRALAGIGMASKASQQYLGADPAYFRTIGGEPEVEACFIGRTKRDIRRIEDALATRPYRVITTATSGKGLREKYPDQVRIVAPGSHREMIAQVVRKAFLAWIPLFRGELEPAGYTNMVDALLSGRGVVISGESAIPKAVLELPGVYLYEPENQESFDSTTERALRDLRASPFRDEVQRAAGQLLNLNGLRESLGQLFERPNGREAALSA